MGSGGARVPRRASGGPFDEHPRRGAPECESVCLWPSAPPRAPANAGAFHRRKCVGSGGDLQKIGVVHNESHPQADGASSCLIPPHARGRGVVFAQRGADKCPPEMMRGKRGVASASSLVIPREWQEGVVGCEIGTWEIAREKWGGGFGVRRIRKKFDLPA